LRSTNNSAASDEAREIGLRIHRIRMTRGTSLRVIAGLAGMSASTLHRTEHGQRDLTVAELVALAGALRIDPAELTMLMIRRTQPQTHVA
jgi:transcriptional regulator with XRE-family HTH domain